MDLRRLRLFVAVAESGGVGRAARRLGMAQPPLTVQIRRLEEEVGTPLFQRGPRGMTPTEAGEAFLLRARESLSLAEEAAEAARAVAAGRRGRLSVGFMLVLSYALLPRLVPALRAALPDLELDLIEMTAATRKTLLLERGVSVGLCIPPLQHPEVEAEVLARVPLVLAMPARDPLARLSEVPVERLRGRPLIGLPRVPRERDASAVSHALLRRLGLSGQLRQTVETVPAALALVRAGEGLAVVPAPAAISRPPGVIVRPFAEGGESVELAACWRRGTPRPLLARFLAATRPVVAAAAREGWRLP
ncbi:LysR family transcriptional regulator [Falsiroseomonas sp.]|uniref:LysR family transcriptional regulator n=1 Tax=Falsiroseomonas sp. TaxID=2870721 RepID=UPI003568680E